MKLYLHITSLVIAATLAFAVGCEDPTWNTVPNDLVTTDSVSINGKVYLISPYGNRVIRIDQETMDIHSVEVGKNPQVLTTDRETAIETGMPVHVYTINHDDQTLSIINVDSFDADPDTYVPTELQLKPFFDQLVFSPSGEHLVSYIGQDVTTADLQGYGSVNPNELAIINLTADPPTVNFRTLESRPTDVIFTEDGSKAVIPMTTDLAVLYMDDAQVTKFPLSLETEDPAQPSMVQTSPDNRRAFVAVNGENDVYIIDMEQEIFETLIPTPFTPRDIAVTPDGAYTVVVGSTAQAMIFDNDLFEPETVDIGTSADTIVMNSDAENPYCFLYNAGLTRAAFGTMEFGPTNVDIETFSTDSAVTRIELDPSGKTAVIFHQETTYGSGMLSIFNLEERYPSPIWLESAPYDMTFLTPNATYTDEAIGYVLVVLKESHQLVRYSLTTYESVVIGVAENPETVSALDFGGPNDVGSFAYVIHEEPLGLLTFLNPYQPLALPAGFPTAYGYGLVGLMD